MTFASKIDNSTPIFKKLGILNFDDSYKLEVSKFMFNFEHGKIPTTFRHLFKQTSEVHNYNTRQASMNKYYLILPKARTNFRRNFINFQGVKIWNDIPINFKLANTP